MTKPQKYLLEQINSGRTFSQYNYKMVSKLQFDDNMETINIRTVQSLNRILETPLTWNIKK